MSSDVIARKVKVDDSDNNIQVVIHDDSIDNSERIKDIAAASVVIEGDFHARVRIA